MFTVYTEKDAFENIVLYKENSPNWYEIFSNHSEICINIAKEDLSLELIPGTVIFEYVNSYGGRTPIALKDFFDSIYDDNSVVISNPRSAYFLNYSSEETEAIQSAYGVIVQSAQSPINDDILTGSFKRKLLKNEQIKDEAKQGWHSLLNFNFPPSNSIIISDNYLLSATEKIGNDYIKSGVINILWLLDALLPQKLSTAYHITIISEDKDHNEVWRNGVESELRTEIMKLRDYDMNIEVVFIKSEHLHERILLMNYVNASCEHGFYVFKCKDGKSIQMVNKLQINSYFSNINNLQGESEFETANKDLKLIKSLCIDLAVHIQSGSPVYLGAILGDCRADKSLNNRLIQEV